MDEVGKVGNMDFNATKAHLKAQAKLVSLEKTQKDLESKNKDAAAYRKKFLSKQPGKKKKKAPSSDKTTFAQCVFNLANILMGVGLLGLPFAFAESGYFGGTFAIISFALVCWKTSILIGRELNGDPRPLSVFEDSSSSEPVVRMRKPIRSFPDIAREAFGNTGAVLLGVVLYFELFSCLAIFIVSMGDHIHELFPSISVTTNMIGVTIFSALPVIGKSTKNSNEPLCISLPQRISTNIILSLVFRTAGLLSYLSLVGTIATICVVLAVVASFVLEGDITEELEPVSTGSHHQAWNSGGLTAAFGLVAYCFSGHAIVPSIYNSMEKPHEFERVVDVTFVIVVVACLAIGLSGYNMFGDFVMDQITLSLNQNSSAPLAMDILTWLMILTAFSKLTLTMFPLGEFLDVNLRYMCNQYLVNRSLILVCVSLCNRSDGFRGNCGSLCFKRFIDAGCGSCDQDDITIWGFGNGPLCSFVQCLVCDGRYDLHNDCFGHFPRRRLSKAVLAEALST